MTAVSVDVWLTLYGSDRFAVGWYLAKTAGLTGSLVVLILLLHGITRLYRDAADANKTLTILATRDSLTGLANRWVFDQFLAEAFQRGRRLALPLSVIMIDVDFFKKFNDRYGHVVGDDCLRRVCAAADGALLRPGDLIARYGGEEIAVVVTDADEAGALLVAERIRAAVAELALPHQDGCHHIVTVSIGVGAASPTSPRESPTDLICAADQALYRSKTEGRNRVSCSSDAALAVLHAAMTH
jgi:diguanylate cyclase (GGDEF)-like protein